MSRLWGPGGQGAPCCPLPTLGPWGQACWNNWLDSSRDGGQSWGCCRGSRHQPPGSLPTAPLLQPPHHPPFQGWGTGLKRGLPQSLYLGGWGMQTRQVQAGVPPTLNPFPCTSPTGRTN